MAVTDVDFYYGSFQALRGVNLEVPAQSVTALIGPSGCGKSTFLRCLNRMNDEIPGARMVGTITLDNEDIYQRGVNREDLRKRIGMVFQRPNPFPMSIFDNVAYGPRIADVAKSDLDGVVEDSLRGAALWDEVKDRLKSSAMGLSGGQQQRLCIARALAIQPEVVLMDEPCSALDPIATSRIEELMQEIKARYTIVIVTHNMQQAARISDRVGFFTTEVSDAGDRRTGVLVEYGRTSKMFSNPSDPRTEAYVTGRFG